MKPRVFISAGHSRIDSGVRWGNIAESELVIKIRDKIKELLPEAIYVPDDLTLRETIDYINSQNPQPEDLAIEIHVNSNQSQLKRGTEAYYVSDPRIAAIFSRCVSKRLGIPDNGAKHDSETYVGSLGFLRFITSCRSVLVETCYLTHFQERNLIITQEGQKLAANGVFDAINEVMGPIETVEPVINWKNVFEALKKVMSLDDIIMWVKKYFGVLKTA